MQNIRDVLRLKEQQMEQLQKEIDALRLSIRILESESTMPEPARANGTAQKDNGTYSSGNLKQFP